MKLERSLCQFRIRGHGVIALRWSLSSLWQLRRVTMTSYAGLDVSQQETQICIIDAAGAVLGHHTQLTRVKGIRGHHTQLTRVGSSGTPYSINPGGRALGLLRGPACPVAVDARASAPVRPGSPGRREAGRCARAGGDRRRHARAGRRRGRRASRPRLRAAVTSTTARRRDHQGARGRCSMASPAGRDAKRARTGLSSI